MDDAARLSRRNALQLLGVGSIATLMLGAPGSAFAAPAVPSGHVPSPPPDDVAATYHRVLLRHTRWAEQQFDAATGAYSGTDFSFAVVLGNALLLTRDGYDAEVAGVSREVLHDHTVATISKFAASNVLNGGTQWGRTLFFDTTFQLYFQLAARLLWNDLDAATRANLDHIAAEQAAYTTSLGSGNDPHSGSWTPNGLNGGFQGDTKLEEMGVYAQSLAPGLAWAASDPRAAAWREAFDLWSRNETGLPQADLANPRLVDGKAISANTARNLYDTFIVENHGSFGPHYQEELWRTSGRNAIHFLTAGLPLPEVLTAQPNGELLWRTMLLVGSDAGEPLMPMVNDREHLYGRDVLPLAFRAQVLGDRHAARAEAMLAERLEPYQAYPPIDRITKFSGEPKYEPEARAELAISYLLHEWRAKQHGGAVRAVSKEDFFGHASGVADFGAGPGLLAHQSPAAWAATVSKPTFVKFAWQPQHDDWLFVLSGTTPMLLPSSSSAVRQRLVTTYSRVRDGFDATLGVLRFDVGTAAFATLPTGAVVYASSGIGAGEGTLNVHNLNMPGIPGLDGNRTYTTADGSVTVPAQPATAPSGARTDDVTFAPVSARYVRMFGVESAPTYGYSMYSFEIRSGSDGTDLAQGKATTASSSDTGFGAALATDGNAGTRWAVSRADRLRADSWLEVDLGAASTIDRVRIAWEAAAGRKYRVETSSDGSTWTSAGEYPTPAVRSLGGWLDVDGRAGLVVRGPVNPITVTGDRIVLSDGPATGLLVEGYPQTKGLAALAAAPVPTFKGGALVKASVVDGYLVLVNVGTAAARGTVGVPQDTHALRLYQGDQTITATGTELLVDLASGVGRIEAARFTVRGLPVPAGLRVSVTNASRVTLTLPSGGWPALVEIEATGGRRRPVQLWPGRPTTVELPEVRPYPLVDLALGATTYPTDPLPPGMSAPGGAVDDNASTTWRPGSDGRMVVDLGAVTQVSAVELAWAGGRIPDAVIEISADGLSYAPAKSRVPAGRTATVAIAAQTRYLAVKVSNWRSGSAELTRFSVRP
jgi:hypothetical protein